MASIEHRAAIAVNPGARAAAVGLSLAAALAGAVLVFVPGITAPAGGPVALSLLVAALVFMGGGGLAGLRWPGPGGAAAFVGALLWMAGCIVFKSFGWALATPPALAALGGLAGMIAGDRSAAAAQADLVYRHDGVTRLTHWVWAGAMFFLLLSGLQIFNARPNLYIGHESGFSYQNSILDIYATREPDGFKGQTKLFGQVFDTTGVLGVSGTAEQPSFTAFPGWATIPSYRDLATGRVVHFFFAWLLVGTLAIWLVNALFNGHFWRDIVVKPRDLGALPGDIVAHLRFRFAHRRSYSPLQKLAYFVVLCILFPLIVLTGLTMSPGMDAAWPFLVDLFGGRQTARTIHFFTMLAFVLFFVAHIAMTLLAGPINALRSMLTGYSRVRERMDD